MAKLTIVERQIDGLNPHPNNPRMHSQKQIRQIAASIDRFGFTNPVLIDESSRIIAGHGRVEAAKLIGHLNVPTVCIKGMNDDEIRAYIIADNRLAENAGWDPEILAIELSYLSQINIEIDTTITGFETPQIDVIIDQSRIGKNAGNTDEADQVPEPVVSNPVTQPGDLWQIGNHRLICGDSTQRETYEALLDEERAQMVFCDPPYNVPINRHVCGLGQIKHREFTMASGEMSDVEFVEFLSSVFGHLAAFSADGSLHYQCMDWRHIAHIMAAGDAAYCELRNLCVWVKENGGMGSLYRSQHELVFVFKSSTGQHINNIELGKHGRYRTNVWQYAGVNGFGATRNDLSLHPTVKPVALITDAILDCSHRGGIILDAFAGSGSTLVAAQKAGRCGYGIEIDPAYCDVTIRRLQNLFDLEAILGESGLLFGEAEKLRTDKTQTVESSHEMEVR